MSTDRQTLIDAVREGETTDPGGMTTTQDVADVVPESYWTVEEELRALRREGAVESKIFGNQRVWVVPDNSRKQTSTAPMPTTTREPATD
jgi:hypothetical protein